MAQCLQIMSVWLPKDHVGRELYDYTIAVLTKTDYLERASHGSNTSSLTVQNILRQDLDPGLHNLLHHNLHGRMLLVNPAAETMYERSAHRQGVVNMINHLTVYNPEPLTLQIGVCSGLWNLCAIL